MKEFVLTLIIYFIIDPFSFAQNGLSEIDAWAYQLQNIDIQQITNNNTFELIVIDYSSDGSEEGEITPQEIAQIKSSGKTVLSYLSIGEVEDYRFYWQEEWDANHDGIPDSGAPPWLGLGNPNWPGNYKVRYWNPEWQQIIFSYIDRIFSQGFDGIYCDIIDAYYYWMELNPEQPYADSLMIEFMLNIRDHTSGLTNDEFFIVPQNGEYIIYEPNVSPVLGNAYLNLIDAIGVEDVFSPGSLPENNPFDPDMERVNILQDYLNFGHNVLSVEYLTLQNLSQQYVEAAQQYNFIPYTTVRDLDTLMNGITTLLNNDFEILNGFQLYQNYPNPFNPVTIINYSLPLKSQVEIVIYNTLGEQIEQIVNEEKEAGSYQIEFDATVLPSGIYFYKLQAGFFVETKKMVLMK